MSSFSVPASAAADVSPRQGGRTGGLLESAARERHIEWIANPKVTEIEAGKGITSVSRTGATPSCW